MADQRKWCKLFQNKFDDFSGLVPDLASATELVEAFEVENDVSCGFAAAVATVGNPAIDLKNTALEVQWSASLPSNGFNIPFLGFPFSVGKRIVIQRPADHVEEPGATENQSEESMVMVDLLTFPTIQVSSDSEVERQRAVQELEQTLSQGTCTVEQAWFLQLPQMAALTPAPHVVMELDETPDPGLQVVPPVQLQSDDWGDCILRRLCSLKDADSQCDVTLVGQDGTSVDAHIAVLSAASRKFESVLRRSKLQLIVKMNSVPTQTLKAAVDFIYSGKAQVDPSDLNSVEKMAESFEISGLLEACQQVQQVSAEEVNGSPSAPVGDVSKPDPACSDSDDSTLKCRVLPSRSSADKSHRLSHLRKKSHWCQKCGVSMEPCGNKLCNPKMAKSKGAKSASSLEFACSHCDKHFKRKDTLVKHLHHHNGTFQYVCGYCSRGFMDRYSFKAHVRNHQGLPSSSKCHICGLAVTTKKGLQKHMATIHERRESYKCEICSAVYRHRSSFMAHGLIHAGKRPHVCEYCNKGFRVKSHLITHMRIHTGEKPYACSVCDRKFAHNNSCKSHQTLCKRRSQSAEAKPGKNSAEKTAKRISYVHGYVEPKAEAHMVEVEVDTEQDKFVYVINEEEAADIENEVPESIIQSALDANTVEQDSQVIDLIPQTVGGTSSEYAEHGTDAKGQYIALGEGRKVYVSLSQDAAIKLGRTRSRNDT